MHMTKADLQRLVNNAIVLEKYSDIMENDVIECFTMEKIEA